MSTSGAINKIISLARLDVMHSQRGPTAARVLLATGVSVVGSLVADAILVAIGTWIFPSTQGYPHFRFFDYGRLTVLGVLIACAAWPVVTRVSFAARWLFLRLAVLVTLALWAPDLYILWGGALPKAVAVLMAMHVAIGIVTYNALVRLAPVPLGKPLPGARGDNPLRRHRDAPTPPRQYG